MARPVIAEMVVVGGGAIGASIAYRLAQSGVGVTLVERRFPGGGISGASFSWVNSFDKKPQAYHLFNVRGIGEHWALAAELGSHDLLHLDGALSWGVPEGAPGASPAGVECRAGPCGPERRFGGAGRTVRDFDFDSDSGCWWQRPVQGPEHRRRLRQAGGQGERHSNQRLPGRGDHPGRGHGAGA